MLEELSLHLTRLKQEPEELLRIWEKDGALIGRLTPAGKKKNDAGLTTTALLARAALTLLPEGNSTRESVLNSCRSILANKVGSSRENGLPWNSFKEDADAATGDQAWASCAFVYTTGRIALDLGEHLDALVSTELYSRTSKGLADFLTEKIDGCGIGNIPYTYRAAIALKSMGLLKPEIRKPVEAAIQAAIHTSVSHYALGARSRLNPIHLSLALALDTEISINPLSHRERDKCLEIALESPESLITLGPTTNVFIGSKSVGASAIEALYGLLNSSPLRRSLRTNLTQIEQSLVWLEEHSAVVRVGEVKVRLFRADLYPQYPNFEGWFNALVLLYLVSIEEFIERASQESLRKQLRATAPQARVSYDQIICGGYRWPQWLDENFLSSVKKLGHTDKTTGNGIVLFGPPGTGKTTLAKVIAQRIGGWHFVALSAADFLVDGRDGVFRRILDIFRSLKQMRNCIAFFDELELLVLEREGPAAEWSTAVITNVMLPELQELHDQAHVIPIFATNHISRFDSAARRPGRFDFVLPVGLPSDAERRRLLKTLISEDRFFDKIESICNGGTISEIIQWAKEYGKSGAPGRKSAKNLWDTSFSRLQVDKSALKKFDSDVKQYSYPPLVQEHGQ